MSPASSDDSVEARGEEWDAVAEGLPQQEDQFIQQYLGGRSALITQEKTRRSDHAFKQALSGTAIEACRIVAEIRDEEQRTIWTSELEDSLANGTEGNVHPGMMFTLAKDRMESTRLWKIVRRMPKGALLHAHFDAMVDIDWLIEEMLATTGMHMMSSEPLTSESARERSTVQFTFARSSHDANPSVWTPAYESSSLVPVTKAADGFPDGGRAGFKAWLKGRCSIGPRESLEHHHGLNAVWRKFAGIFRILGTIIYYEPIFRAFVTRMCRQLLDDGVRWMDFRVAFFFPYRRTDCETPEPDCKEAVRVLGEEIEKFKNSEDGKGFWGARMIWTTIRSFSTKDIVASMKQCIAAKKAYPHLIAGFDLVGQEDLGRPLKDLTPELFWFRKRCVEEGLEIPFFFHAGECLGDGDETDENLFDALLLGTRRIGHGFSLYKHPLLIDLVKEKKILVESCPISNEILRLTGSILSHPLPALLARGVPVALCNDDPAILGQDTEGMTHDFWQALQGWQNLGLAGLGALAENSVRWAAFEDQNTKDWLNGIKNASVGGGVRAERLKEWAIEWERFCQWVVDEYGAESGTEDG
ncbi:MAG: hypothetical protein M1816_005691 [Peltula sp. TS41687]|nr:MAG: hypothetical protein M1816_005691 [Peltula sp. TS41687]